MTELQHFFHAGDVWICKRCDEKMREIKTSLRLPRYYREGEAESKETALSAPIAIWADDSHRELHCSHCGISEIRS